MLRVEMFSVAGAGTVRCTRSAMGDLRGGSQRALGRSLPRLPPRCLSPKAPSHFDQRFHARGVCIETAGFAKTRSGQPEETE